MHTDSNPNIAALYDAAAPTYDELWAGRAEYRAEDELLRILARHGVPAPSSTILSLGCGTGAIASRLSGSSSCSFTGVEISSGMADVARRRGWHVLEEDFADFIRRQADESFDVVLAMSSLYFAPRGDEIMRHMVRVSRVCAAATFERFDESTVTEMRETGIVIRNHELPDNLRPDVVYSGTLWRRPQSGHPIDGKLAVYLKRGH